MCVEGGGGGRSSELNGRPVGHESLFSIGKSTFNTSWMEEGFLGSFS